jgi:hypothetical protein
MSYYLWCCEGTIPRSTSFCMTTIMSLFWVASKSLVLTSARGGGGGGLLCGACHGHAHDLQIPHGRQA